MSDGQLINLYKQLEYILHLDDGWLWQDLFRKIGEWLIFGIAWLNNFIEQNINKVITLNDFYSSEPIKNFMDTARPIIWGLFLLALVVLGIQFMLNKIEKREEIFLNVVLALSVIVVIPDLMVNMGKITNAGIFHINEKDETLAGGLIKSNVADVLYYAENDFRFSSGGGGLPRPVDINDSSIGTTDFTRANRFSENALRYISFSEKLDKESIKNLGEDAKKVLENKLVATGNGDGFVVRELSSNQIPMTKLGQESYYRFHVNWMVLILSLLVTTVALAITVIKIGRNIFDLAFHQVFGMFIAATDLTGGQRTKKVLVEIMNTFAVIFIMMMLLKFFIYYSIFANGLKSSVGSVIVLLLLIAGAWALIDAPDIVARMLGIDAGLRSGYQSLMGAYAGTKLAGAGIKGAGKLAAGTALGTAGAANFARRTATGMFSKTPGEFAKAKSSNRTAVEQMPNNNKPNNDLNTIAKKNSQTDSIPETSSHSNNNLSGGEGSTGESNQDGLTKAGTIPETSTPTGSSGSPSGGSGSGQGTSRVIPTSQDSSSKVKSIPETSTSTGGSPSVGGNISRNVEHSQPRFTNDGSVLKHGHKEANHSNTWFGGNQQVRQVKESITRAGNSGFSLGQSVRKVSRGAVKATGKGAINATRAVIHPKETLKYGANKTKEIAQASVHKVKDGASNIKENLKEKVDSTVKEIKRPPGGKDDES